MSRGQRIARGGAIIVTAAILGDLLFAAAFLLAAEYVDSRERI